MSRKLRLNRETLRMLSREDLRVVRGGVTGACPTADSCLETECYKCEWRGSGGTSCGDDCRC